MIGRKASGEQQQQDGLGVEDGLGGERGVCYRRLGVGGLDGGRDVSKC